jgi:hypothetical protein
MISKTLVTGLGACVIFLAGFCLPDNANASFTNPFPIKTDLLKQKSSPRKQDALGVNLKEGFSNLLLANRRNSIRRSNARNNRENSNYRQTNTGRNRPHGRSNYKINRQSNPRFIQRNSRAKFSNPIPRTLSTRKRTPNNRSSVGTNNLRDNRNILERTRSRKVEFITPRNRTR